MPPKRKPALSIAGRTSLKVPGKSSRLVVLGEAPLVAETPESLLDDDTTPTEKFFIRNNGSLPERMKHPGQWTVTIDGEVHNDLTLTLGELKSKFKHVTQRMVLECGGNGRAFFSPQTPGVQWTNGGVGCAEWTGVRLADVLRGAGLKPSAIFSGHYGAEPKVAGHRDGAAISRGVPIRKLIDKNNLIVWAMNGEPLPLIHGFPVRLVIPGWPGSVSTKWLTRIWIRDRVHDGEGMGGTSYRVPVKPIAPGEKTDGSNFRDLESMPVRSIITNPADGMRLASGTRSIALRGAAWAGDLAVKSVAISIDYGATWRPAKLAAPRNPHDWQRWTHRLNLPSDGYFEIWVRATDSNNVTQPHLVGKWNPQGYGGNPMHRIVLTVG